ncbi:hypothetical protein OY671_002012 [Metschnikowia pulcherrima]|nr:hypothetical protein OY671_002012 [Metschnikowia pulcherrima]
MSFSQESVSSAVDSEKFHSGLEENEENEALSKSNHSIDKSDNELNELASEGDSEILEDMNDTEIGFHGQNEEIEGNGDELNEEIDENEDERLAEDSNAVSGDELLESDASGNSDLEVIDVNDFGFKTGYNRESSVIELDSEEDIDNLESDEETSDIGEDNRGVAGKENQLNELSEVSETELDDALAEDLNDGKSTELVQKSDEDQSHDLIEIADKSISEPVFGAAAAVAAAAVTKETKNDLEADDGSEGENEEAIFEGTDQTPLSNNLISYRQRFLDIANGDSTWNSGQTELPGVAEPESPGFLPKTPLVLDICGDRFLLYSGSSPPVPSIPDTTPFQWDWDELHAVNKFLECVMISGMSEKTKVSGKDKYVYIPDLHLKVSETHEDAKYVDMDQVVWMYHRLICNSKRIKRDYMLIYVGLESSAIDQFSLIEKLDKEGKGLEDIPKVSGPGIDDGSDEQSDQKRRHIDV